MSTVKIDWIETKGPDWKVATLTNEMNKTEKEVSINRTSKKGEVFPNFDTLQAGMTIEGELWQSGAGKWYLFPPQPKAQYRAPNATGGASGAFKGGIGAKLMDKKAENIEKAQENRSEGVKIASTMRMAVDIVTAHSEMGNWDDDSIRETIKQWRAWLWNEWDADDSKFPPFNNN